MVDVFSPSHRDQSRWKPSYIKRILEGFPEYLDELSDRGLHNRGEFSKELAWMGCQILRSPKLSWAFYSNLGGHGGLLKAMVIRVIAELPLVGREAIQHVLTQSVMTKNSPEHRLLI